ncbi:MAG: type II toxin-antitoxin system VapC family toxin [Desulfobacteraceae bacterium]|nr:type II toxin-antitoxin system VapC family toxin [Desulfobacteraceae bacterium]
MSKKQIFMDTAFLIAVIDDSDNYHETASESYKKLVIDKWTVFTTEAVLTEIGNGLSKLKWRQTAYRWIETIRKSRKTFNVVPVTPEIMDEAIKLYGSRPDKEWGITDCISFIVMQKYNLTKALTADHHFEQAGYIISLTPYM